MLVVGALGGRFDQEMKCFDSILRYHKHMFADADTESASANVGHYFDDIILLDHSNLVKLLCPDRLHVLHPVRSIEGPVCGLLPLYGPVQDVVTTGLKWNLHHQPMAFGQQISTSNQLLTEVTADADVEGQEEQTVTIQTSEPLIWTIELHLCVGEVCGAGDNVA